MGYSTVKDIVYSKEKDKEAEYNLANVEIDINIVEVL